MSIVICSVLNVEQTERDERTYANPRNFAAGSLRQLDAAVSLGRPIRLGISQIVALEGADIEPSATQWEALAYLALLGFPVEARDRLFDDFTARMLTALNGAKASAAACLTRLTDW